MAIENGSGQAADDIDVDQLLEEIESPKEAVVQSAPEQTETPAPAADQWNGQEWEFDWNGKKIFPDNRDKAKTWMSQGYNYSQRMGELNKTHAQKMAEIQALEEKYKGYDRYAEIDQYARQNKEWWEHVQKGWDSRSQQPQGQVDPSIAQLINPLKEQIERLAAEREQERQVQAQKELENQHREQDAALDTEIEEIRKAYPNIDLDSVDQASGKTLMLRIFEHAGEIGTSSFRAAYRDYLHEKLVDLAKSNGREAIAKDQELKAKKGILGQSPTPKKGFTALENPKAKSYDAIHQEVLEELAAGRF
jgi:hypothetical protein